MFTGIIEKTLQIVSATHGAGTFRLAIAHDWPDVKLGESIAINGVCLTIANLAPGLIDFDVIKETLDKTNLGLLTAGDEVNVERALRAGDRIDGHFVQGHVDGTGLLVTQTVNKSEWRLTIQSPPEITKYLAPKGSICIDGVSLTIAALKGDQFDVALIPTTLQITTLKSKVPGWRFNLEADIISKQIVMFLEQRSESLQKSN